MVTPARINFERKINQMGKMKFKTNINCGGCVAKVTPKLNEAKGILSWNVETGNPDKLLTVETDSLPKEAIMELVKTAGFRIEPL